MTDTDNESERSVLNIGRVGRLACIGGFILVLAIAMLMMNSQEAKASVTLGDTVISTPGNVYADDTYYMEGNLTIASGGELTLSNMTLLFNLTSDGDYWLNVTNGGTLNINSGTLITSNDTLLNYDFWYMMGSAGLIENSIIERAGYSGAGSEGLSFSVPWDTNMVLNNVTVRDSGGSGIAWETNLTSVTMTDCDIYGNANSGMVFYNLDETAFSLTLTNTDVSNNLWSGIKVQTKTNGTFSFQMTNSTIEWNDYGVYFPTFALDNVDVTVNVDTGSSIANNTDAGIGISTITNGSVIIQVSNSVINDQGESGIYVGGISMGDVDIHISGTSLDRNWNGIGVMFLQFGDLTVTADQGSSMSNNSAAGIYVETVENGNASIQVSDSVIRDNSGDGVYVEMVTTGNLDILLSNSAVDWNFEGIYVTDFQGGDLTVNVDMGSSISNNSMDGIWLTYINNGNVSVQVSDSVIRSNGPTGIFVETVDTGDLDISISNSIVEWNGRGIDVFDMEYGDLTMTVDLGSSISHNNDDGINVGNTVQAGITVSIDGSSINDNAGYGISLFGGSTLLKSSPQISLLNSYFLRNGNYGFHMGIVRNVDVIPVIQNVVFDSNMGGLYFEEVYYGDFALQPTGNFDITDTLDLSGGSGVYLGKASGDITIDLANKDITGQGNEAIYLNGYDPIYYSSTWLPSGRLGTSAAYDGEYVYIFGGTTQPGNNDINQIVVYDPSTDSSWVHATVLPTARMFTSAVWDGGEYIYVIGGETTWHGGYRSEILRFNTTDGSITNVANLPSARMGTSAVWDGQYVYIFGGYTGSPRTEIYRFDPVSTMVIMVGSLPYGVYWTSAVWDGQYAYIIGGYDNGWSSSWPYTRDEILRFDPSDNSVDVAGYMPMRLMGTSAVWDGSRVYIFAGDRQNYGWIQNTVYEFDPSTGQTSFFGVFPYETSWTSAATDGSGKIFVFGGYWSQSSIIVFDLGLFALPTYSLDITIQNSNISANGNGIYIDRMFDVTANIAITGSTLKDNNDDALLIDYFYFGQLTIDIVGNDLTNNGDALYINEVFFSDTILNVHWNDMSNSSSDGIYIYWLESCTITAYIENNTFNDLGYAMEFGYPGYFDLDRHNPRPSYFYIYNNVAYNVDYGVIYHDENYYGQVYFFIDNLVATGDPATNWAYFFDFEYAYYGNLYVDMKNVDVSGGYSGFYFSESEQADVFVTIQDSVFTDMYYGVYLESPAYYSDLFKLDITNTQFYTSQDGYGIYIEQMGDDYGCRMEMNIVDSLFEDYSGDTGWYYTGIYVSSGYYGNHEWTITNTDFLNYADYGWDLEEMDDGARVTVWMYDGSFQAAPGEFGATIYVYQSGYEGIWDIHLVSVDGDKNFEVDESWEDPEQQLFQSYVTVYWYLDVTVLTGLNLDQPAQNVTVSLHDRTGTYIAGGMTDPSGQLNQLLVKQYKMGYAYYEPFTPHMVSASNGASTVTGVASMTADQAITLYLTGDADADGLNDLIDPDDDNDGYADTVDEFPNDPTEWRDTDGDGIGDNADTDDDNDGIPDVTDAFPYDPKEWSDLDGDGVGDNSDWDIDGDGVGNEQDAFPYDATEWEDTDGDGIGDEVDTDDDGDGVLDVNDAFPKDPTEWEDTDGDGLGDNKDTDDDNDGYSDTTEEQAGSDPKDPLSVPLDTDGDGIPDIYDQDDDGDGVYDGADAFPLDPTEWRDSDGDGIGDNADTDDDNDGVPDANDLFPYDPTEWDDWDGDGLGDNKDTDDDNDGYSDEVEGQNGTDPRDPFSVPPDTDGDGIIDQFDPDDDNDGVPDERDAFPKDPNEWRDRDGDGIGDNADTDDDGDGVPDTTDAFPDDPGEWSDLDGDGIGDNSDWDIDGDGVANEHDAFPYDPDEWRDTDGDGTGDDTDTDDDGDGVPDTADAFPLNPDEWSDADGDGVGDNRDWDIDGDGVANERDAFPHNDTEWTDTDDDGIGNNEDTDDDGDGVLDATDRFPLNPNEWSDLDGDGVGDNSDIDIDGDGVMNEIDEDPYDATESSTIIPSLDIPSQPDYTMLLAVIAVLLVVILIAMIGLRLRKPAGGTPPKEEKETETEEEESIEEIEKELEELED